MGALIKAEEAGIRVPDDIAIVRYDDSLGAGLLRPALTAVASRSEHIGSGVMELMLERLTGGADVERRNEFLPFDLVIRDSALDTEFLCLEKELPPPPNRETQIRTMSSCAGGPP